MTSAKQKLEQKIRRIQETLTTTNLLPLLMMNIVYKRDILTYMYTQKAGPNLSSDTPDFTPRTHTHTHPTDEIW